MAELLRTEIGDGKVFFDEWFEAELAGHDAQRVLQKIYLYSTRLVVSCICKRYAEKPWTQDEWRAIEAFERTLRPGAAGGSDSERHRFLPLRFGDGDLDGLFATAIVPDVRTRTPKEIADLILERWRLTRQRPARTQQALKTPVVGSVTQDWPVTTPLLHWSVADHREAHDAFAKLITRGSSYRLLPICGESGTGKSHLTKQFLSNAVRIAGLTFGRFDFKGSTDIEREVRIFSDALQVPTPRTGIAVSLQLADILSALRSIGAPTLLVFDTFEHAGEAERWVKETLLLLLVRSPWLRVIVVGQRTTHPHGEPWASWSAPVVELRLPTPEDWFAYGREHRPNEPLITLDMVRSTHALCNGQSAVLSQLLGPSGRRA